MVDVRSDEADLCAAKTYVFLDIETTGLPHMNFGKANITELTMWTSPRKGLLKENRPTFQRMLNKFTMCFNPSMMISTKSSEITGLYNDMLEDYNKFDENAGKAIISYLNHYPKPICLIAHNGTRFDFPIIKKSLEKIGLIMPDYILCSDSLQILKALDKIEENRILEEEKQNENSLQKSDKSVDDDTAIILEDYTYNELFDDSVSKLKERQRMNETTPRRNHQDKYSRKHTGNGAIVSDETNNKSTCKARKELFPPQKVIDGKVKKKQKSFKLVDVYERMFGSKPHVAHTAEADVEALYQIALKCGDAFIEHADKYAIPFANINGK